MDYKELGLKAIEARKFSYAPYSKYNVGAALLCDDESVVMGCNVENASYGCTVCAERNAVFKAVSMGKRNFKAIAICGDKEQSLGNSMAFPCGVCRQVLREFSEDMDVIVVKDEEEQSLFTLKELLPNSFGGDNIK